MTEILVGLWAGATVSMLLFWPEAVVRFCRDVTSRLLGR